VSDAGIALVATLTERLGIERLVERFVRLRRDRPGAGSAGRKVIALVYAMVLGADCIDACQLVRSGRTRRLLGGWLPAPSTLGTFLRAFTFGHVRQLDRVLGEALRRAWAAGAGPGAGRLVVDIDSFVGEVHGYDKQGAAFGYTHKRGYHPLLASRAETGEVLHVRLRKGSANTARGAVRFVCELIARVERTGATGIKLLRADSGFWNNKLIARLERAGWQYSIGVRLQGSVADAIEQIPETGWRPLADYPDDGEAQIAETVLGSRRLIVRRTRLVGAQAELWPDWRHFAFITNRTEPLELVEAEHRQHAVVELAIREPQRPSTRALPLRHVQRQRRLDGDRLPGPQPAALDEPDRAAGSDRPRGAHAAPPAAQPPRPPDPLSPAVDAASPRPLAVATRLRPRARAHPGTAGRGLTAAAQLDHQPSTRANPGATNGCTRTSPGAPPQARTTPPVPQPRPTPLTSPKSCPLTRIDESRRWIEAKAVNILAAALLASDPHQAGGQRVMFLSGDDADAKSAVRGLFEDAGFYVLDLGGLREGGRMHQLGGPLVGENLIRLP
jgi:Transposase DDE domain group 1